jgi:hypothetical protein
MRGIAFPVLRTEMFQNRLPTAKNHRLDGAYAWRSTISVLHWNDVRREETCAFASNNASSVNAIGQIERKCSIAARTGDCRA